MTYTYRCIGKGTTDSNGVAHITHDCSGNALSDDGYKGVGAGLMDFIASTDAPADISDGSFQSETFSILDCGFYDKGLEGSGNHNTKYVNTGVTVSYDGTGTTLLNETDSNKYYLPYDPTTTKTNVNQTFDWSSPFKIEFEVVSTDNTGVMFYCVNDGSPSTTAHQDITTTGSFSKEISIGGNCSIGFRLGAGKTITFKNLKIYPI